MLSVTVTRDTTSDAVVQVSGVVAEGHVIGELIVYPLHFAEPAKALRLLGVMHAIQDGLTILLYWHSSIDEHELIMPLEGRGRLDLEYCQGIKDPRSDAGTGCVYLITETFKPGKKHFFLSLDFSKMRE